MNLDCTACIIRSWQPGDELGLADHANDRELWLNLRDRFPHPYTQADAEQWVDFMVTTKPETSFAITVGGQAVGGIGLILREDIERYSAEVGYWLSRQHWGRGIVTAALQSFTQYAIRHFGLVRLYAVPFLRNRGSVRVLEKAGYEREGILRRSAIKDGVFLDQALYAYVVQDA